MNELKEGWVWLYNAKKEHYIVEGRSLCGRWGYMGGAFHASDIDSPDNCKACVREFKKRQAAKKRDGDRVWV
jgi:hypothetical protein